MFYWMFTIANANPQQLGAYVAGPVPGTYNAAAQLLVLNFPPNNGVPNGMGPGANYFAVPTAIQNPNPIPPNPAPPYSTANCQNVTGLNVSFSLT